jgi:hypothetical protein
MKNPRAIAMLVISVLIGLGASHRGRGSYSRPSCIDKVVVVRLTLSWVVA